MYKAESAAASVWLIYICSGGMCLLVDIHGMQQVFRDLSHMYSKLMWTLAMACEGRFVRLLSG